MNCRDFVPLWQERLDALGPDAVARDVQLDAHAAACPACREIYTQFVALRTALRAVAPPAVPAGFADRALAAFAAEPAVILPLRAPSPWRVTYGRAAAAALVLAAGIASARWLTAPSGPVVADRPVIAAVPGDRPLADSLGDMTSATLHLALETSGPAARVGREVLGSAADPDPTPAEAAGPSALDDGGEILRRLGDGVRPLSTPARRAFSFLLGPADAPADSPRNG